MINKKKLKIRMSLDKILSKRPISDTIFATLVIIYMYQIITSKLLLRTNFNAKKKKRSEDIHSCLSPCYLSQAQ